MTTESGQASSVPGSGALLPSPARRIVAATIETSPLYVFSGWWEHP